MKAAVIGSRNILHVDIEKYLPDGVTEIISGEAKGVDSLAKEFAICKGLKLTEYLPEYNRYKKIRTIKKKY